jgi:hypothetical protein
MNRVRPPATSAGLLRTLLPAAALLLGCGSDTVYILPSETAAGANEEPVDVDEGRGPSSEPVYVVFSTIDTPDGRLGYFVTTPSIDGDLSLDVTRGVEVPGGGQLYAPPRAEFLLVGDGESPSFTRYDLDASGDLVRGRTLSFANLGVNDVWRHMIFADEDRAYFLDYGQLQIIRFNPVTMEVEGTIAVDDFVCEGETQTEFGEPIRRPDGFYFTRSCWDLDVTSRGASLVHLDPVTDTVTVSHDARCMGMQVGFLADSGNAYWFADHDASMEWSVQDRDAPHDCGLRLLAGETTFDPEWELDLTARTGGRSAVASVPAGGSSVWVKVFEPEAMSEPLPVEAIDYTLKVWRWGLLDVESDADVQLDTEADLTVYYGPPILVDDRRFSPSTTFSELGDETTLVELTADGVERRLRVAGELRKVFRLR